MFFYHWKKSFSCQYKWRKFWVGNSILIFSVSELINVNTCHETLHNCPLMVLEKFNFHYYSQG